MYFMIIYSNIAGTCVFDEKYNLVEFIEFSVKDLPLVEKKLRNNDWLDSEITSIEKYKNDIKLLGKRNGNRDNVPCFINSKIAQNISKLLLTENLRENLYKNNLILTKKSVRDSVSEDLLIMQSINSIDELKLITARLSQRLREWYELYNPEFSHSVADSKTFAEIILKKSKKDLLKEIKLSEEETMGADIANDDVKPILDIAKKLIEIFNETEVQEKYLEKLMQKRCPNLNAVCGSLIGAKLIEISGSLESLANSPASTIQLLGAEKALFRHLRGGNKPPKHGIIVTHPIVSTSRNKGKSARMFANKIAIASRVDFHNGEFVGDKLKKELDIKLKNI